MHGRHSVFKNQPADPAVVIIHQFRRPHCLRHDDDVLCPAFRHPVVIAAEIGLQPVGHVPQIVQTLAHIAVGTGGQPVPHVFVSAFDRRLRGQAALDVVGDFAVPALVFGKHPVSVQNIDVFSEPELGGIELGVQILVHLMMGDFQPPQFLFPVFGKNVGHRLTTSVHDGGPDAIPFV